MTAPPPALPPVVELIWDSFPVLVYVRGHFDAAAEEAPRALEAAGLYLEDLAELEDLVGWTRPRLGIGRQIYARWGFAHTGAGYGRGFHLSDSPSRGAFPVTEVVDLDERGHRQTVRRAQDRYADELEAMIRARYPEATEVEGQGYPVGAGTVVFNLPGLVGLVWFRAADPKHVQIQTQDVEAWIELYQGRLPPTPAATLTPGGSPA